MPNPLHYAPDSQPTPLTLIAEDLRRVDVVIDDRLKSGVPLVAQVSRYIISAGGKRLRPSLLLMICGALGVRSSERFTLAAVVEFIHTATLLHDDVVDDSTLRRGNPTANETFGNPASVLVGDFLYSRAFQMMVEVGNMRVMEVLSDATNVIAEGEVLQLMNMHDASLSEAAYLHVIRSKTAKLFEASARLAAILACADAATEEACATYGQALGTAFQIIDDVLDYTGTAEEMGKNLGDDLREGKATLPLIAAMQRAGAADALEIKTAIENGSAEQLERIAAIVRRTGSLEVAKASASAEVHRAMTSITNFPANVYKTALMELGSQLLLRKT